MAKSGVTTPSLIERYMQLIGMGELFSIFKTLAKAKSMEVTSHAKMNDAQIAKASELTTRLQTDETQLDTSQYQLKNLLGNKGIIVNHVGIKNPEDWINAVHVLSQYIEHPSDLITALEDTVNQKKQAVQKKSSGKDVHNTIIQFFDPENTDTALTINFKSPALSSISIVKNDQNILFYLHPQGKTLIFDKSDVNAVTNFYQSLTQSMQAHPISLTQYSYPQMEVKKRKDQTQDVQEMKSRAGAIETQRESKSHQHAEVKKTQPTPDSGTSPAKKPPTKSQF